MRKPGIPPARIPEITWRNRPAPTGHSECSCTSKWPPYSNERCRSQSLSQVNHSIDPVPDHTSEVDAATKLLDNACQKLQGIQNIPSQRVTDLEAAIRQLRQIKCILDSCTISASYEVSQAQKALLLLPHTAKGKHIIGRAQCTNIATH